MVAHVESDLIKPPSRFVFLLSLIPHFSVFAFILVAIVALTAKGAGAKTYAILIPLLVLTLWSIVSEYRRVYRCRTTSSK